MNFKSFAVGNVATAGTVFMPLIALVVSTLCNYAVVNWTGVSSGTSEMVCKV